MKYFQQGDVVMIPKKLPDGFEATQMTVVQEGEHTGHAHRLQPDYEDAVIYEHPKTKQKHLRLVKPTKITHEEHKEIDLPKGDYEVRIVREYDHFDEEARAVLD